MLSLISLVVQLIMKIDFTTLEVLEFMLEIASPGNSCHMILADTPAILVTFVALLSLSDALMSNVMIWVLFPLFSEHTVQPLF